MLAGDFFLKLLNTMIFKFDNPSAAVADQMIMVVFIVDRVVTGLTLPKLALLRDTALTEEMKGTINCSNADGRVLLKDLPVELLGCDVPFHF